MFEDDYKRIGVFNIYARWRYLPQIDGFEINMLISYIV